jgi:hypothetical protein
MKDKNTKNGITNGVNGSFSTQRIQNTKYLKSLVIKCFKVKELGN